MMISTCYCGCIEYKMINNVQPINITHGTEFIDTLAVVSDPNQKISRYIIKDFNFSEHAFCGNCGASIYKIDNKGKIFYALHNEVKLNYEYSGALGFGL